MRIYVLFSKKTDQPMHLDAFHTKERAIEEFLFAIGVIPKVSAIDFDPDNFARAAGFREPIIGEVWSFIDSSQSAVLKGVDSKG